jgi:hypothetical protein
MDIQRAMYGLARIIGQQFPQEFRQRQREIVEDRGKEIIKYFWAKKDREDTTENRFHDMNPEGFWECVFSVHGIRYQIHTKNLIEQLQNDWRIVKVVSQGLLNSDPTYINRMVFMLRHPYAVAKSQEKLHRELRVNGENIYDGATDKDGNSLGAFIIHSPQMFIKVTTQAMQFFLEYRDIPFLIVKYEDLLENPEAEITRIYDFNGKPGDLAAGIACVRKELNRSSKHNPKPSRLWDDAIYLHEAMLKFRDLHPEDPEAAYKLLEDTIEEINNPRREIHKEENNWPCYRAKQQTNFYKCLECRANIISRLSIRDRSEAMDSNSKIADNWRLEPCPFECGMDPDNEPISIEESIANNFFQHTIPLDTERYKNSIPPEVVT